MQRLDWKITIDSMKDEVPRTQFQNWIQPVELLRQDERSVVLGVPSRFHGEWLKKNYSQEIQKAIRKQCGSELQLEFEILNQEVEQQNIEACVTPPTTSAELPPISAGRPNLRVVTNPAAPEPAEERTLLDCPLPAFPNELVELDFNRVALQCSHMYFSQPALGMNPLVITGSVGSGKTHLLADLGRRWRDTHPGKQVWYTSAEAFTAEMVCALKSDRMLAFKKKYREQIDYLIFDDIHQLTKRIKSQEELLHIFNEIVMRGGKIVFSSAVPIHRLEEFIDPLKSRLMAGLLCEIRYPSYSDRVSLLETLSKLQGMEIDPPVLKQIADGGQKDVRELIGSMLRFHLQARLQNIPLDTEFLAHEGVTTKITKPTITLDEIIALVDHTYRVPRTELVSKSRKGNTTWARQVAMFLARHYTLLPLEEIGKAFGRDHATVIHAFSKVTEMIENTPSCRYEVEFLRQKLENKSPVKP